MDETHYPTMHLRWIDRIRVVDIPARKIQVSFGNPLDFPAHSYEIPERVLQQLWHHKIAGQGESEWRDVPLAEDKSA